MGFVPKWSRDNQKKTSQRTYSQGEVKQLPSLFHGAKDAQFSAPNLFADGGEVSEEVLKSEGLKASEGEKVGFFDRLKAGNIDEPGSEAYNRFGAGRGRRERDAAAAFKQMDDIEASRKAAPKVETFPLADNKIESDAEASQREEGRNAEMSRLMNQAKKEATRPARPAARPAAAPAPTPAPKPSAPASAAKPSSSNSDDSFSESDWDVMIKDAERGGTTGRNWVRRQVEANTLPLGKAVRARKILDERKD